MIIHESPSNHVDSFWGANTSKGLYCPEYHSPVPSAAGSGPSRSLKRTYALAGKYCEYGVQERISHNNKIGFTDISTAGFSNGISITKCRAPLHRKSNQGRKTHGELFEQLDAQVKPGIMTMQFKSIFTECECGMVTTQHAFFMHECIEDLLYFSRDFAAPHFAMFFNQIFKLRLLTQLLTDFLKFWTVYLPICILYV